MTTMPGHRTWKWKERWTKSWPRKTQKRHSIEKRKLIEIIIQEGSGKREVTMRKSSLRESSNYDANNSYATSANSNGWPSRKDCSKSSNRSESSAAQGGSRIRLRPQWPGCVKIWGLAKLLQNLTRCAGLSRRKYDGESLTTDCKVGCVGTGAGENQWDKRKYMQ